MASQTANGPERPRVVVLGLASDYGCQVQMTNIEDDLLDVLGLIDLAYWQLASSGHLPESYDVAIVEGTVTTPEHVRLLADVREKAHAIVALGSCAVTGGIPAMAGMRDPAGHRDRVYGGVVPTHASELLAPAPISSVVRVDYAVPGCPIDTDEFIEVLGRVLLGLADRTPQEPLCATCKTKENICFVERGALCLGAITRTGCGARCPGLGRPCTGCRGVAGEANLPAARQLFASRGWGPDAVALALSVYNSAKEVTREWRA